MSKHTAGPWTCSKTGNGGRRYVEAAGVVVASVFGGSNQPREANARLIAAAPELLATLKSVRDGLSQLGFAHPAIASIDAVVARAEGRS